MSSLRWFGTMAFFSSIGLPLAAQTPTPSPVWTAHDPTGGFTYFGHSVASAGDVNGDGFDDVIVGAYWETHPEFDEGSAYVYLGSAAGLSASPDWTAEVDQASAWFGFSVASAGDVNGDGFDDVIVGAPNFSNGQPIEGGAFLYLGSATGLATVPAWTAEGEQASAHFGTSVAAAGDVNGDGFDDVIVGAPGHGPSGRAFVYLGSALGLATSAAWSQSSAVGNDEYGTSVASAGDINGDGFDDVIVGAPNLSNDKLFEGRTYVYPGSAAGLSTTPISGAEGNQTSAHFGTSVASAGDVDHDGFDDVIVGTGAHATLYRGGPAGLSSQVWSAPDAFGYGLGHSIAGAGDVNSDGFADVVIGAGVSTFLFLGSAAGLGDHAAWLAADYGDSVASAGDIDGDGFDDVIGGASSAVRVVRGSARGLGAFFPGEGINEDNIDYVDSVPGRVWSAPLGLGHYHAPGTILLLLRTATVNGPVFTSPYGGRRTQLLVAGTSLAKIFGSHNGFSGDIPPQLIPNQPALLGVDWAAQYLVSGGGYVDFSRAVFGQIHLAP